MQALQNKEKSPWDRGIFPMDQLYKKDEKSDLRKGFQVQCIDIKAQLCKI